MKLAVAILFILPCAFAQLGGLRPFNANVKDPAVQFALKGINDKYNSDGNQREIVQIVSSQYQVVAGYKYYYTLKVSAGDKTEICSVRVWFDINMAWTPSRMYKLDGEPICRPEQPASNKLGLLGAPKEVQFNDPEVQEAYKQLEIRANQMANCYCYQVGTQAQKVTKQVVNGIKFQFTQVQFFQSDCNKKDVQESPNRLCLARANTAPMTVCSGDVVKSFDDVPKFSVDNLVCSSAQQASKRAGIPGGVNNYQTVLGDPKVQFAIKAINKFYQDQGDNAVRTAEKIIKATSQVVTGVLYTFNLKINGGAAAESCEVKVLEQDWTGMRPYTQQGDVKCTPLSRRRNVGQPEPVDFNDPGVQAAFKDLQARVNVMSNGLELLKGQEPQSITRQVVSGLKYVFNGVPFYKTECMKTDAIDACQIPNGAQPASRCSGEVYVPATGASSVSNVVCSSNRLNVGQPEPADFNDPGVQAAFKDLQARVNVMSNGLELLKGQEPQSITRQVVFGFKYVFTDVPFYKTSCGKSDSIDTCAIPNGAQQVSKCSGEVYVPPGGPSTVSNVVCSNPSSNEEADQPLSGAPTPITVAKDDERVTFAVGAINKFFKDQGDNLVRSVQEVISATQQVVAGVKYVFTLRMSTDEECKVVILSQPWISQQPQLLGNPSCLAKSPSSNDQVDRPLAGAATPITVAKDDERVTFAVGAINKFFKDQGDNLVRSVQEVISATQQVVAGVKYVFTLRMSTDEECKVVILSQPWISQQPQLLGNPSCLAKTPSSGDQGSSPMVGAPVPITLAKDDEKVAFALGAINKFFKDQGDNLVRSVQEVISATSQVVSGVKYVLTLKMNGGNSDEKCKVSILSQPWISEQPQLLGNPACEAMSPSNEDQGESVPMPGAPFPITVAKDDEKVAFAVNAINKFFKDQGDNLVRSVQEVISATSQVVSGVKYTFSLRMSGGASDEKCEVSILSQPWITKQPQLLNNPSCVALPTVQNDGVPGGETTVIIQDPALVQHAMETINDLYKSKGDNNIRELVRVVKATQQVVAGAKYKYTLEIKGGNSIEECEVHLWARPWLNGPEAIQVVDNTPLCHPKAELPVSRRDSRPGGESPYPASLDDAEVKFAVQAINAFQKAHGDNNVRTPVKVVSATSSVVAGVRYNFKLEFTGGASNEVCDVAVWSRPWMTGAEKMQVIPEYTKCIAL